ncbi:glycine--tRNA ligase [Patescibacteria group bacterium]|nr:glycine--tRNA ligase [Candidatus Falkowbacteria bacterium]MBU3905655.1 glycine--tRNA ligase [Patescibacteria group bacterium]MBU4014770.1 glycine--tRNA ligase [Patescibacteria group bacterium]MBU4026743.1 glycine--tRNA ligase [Patescibacteria group bacterium]MBU4073044.1 glycine--tRNA ligase [Patescibacteria group bacterium]
MKQQEITMEKIVSLCKRRGFIFPCSEIYGGFANSYSFGPYGTELKNNIKKLWWEKFVSQREDIVGIDGPILLHPKVWEASGHTTGFNDAMADCKECKKRFRADHLVEEATGRDMEGRLEEMTKILKEKKIKCPECQASNWTEVKNLNMMFKTEMNGINEPVYLRPETAGAIFIEFKNILDSMRVKIPFGIAQIGKAFRNEIVAGNFIFRIREFEQMEIEYFFNPEMKWEDLFEKWLKLQEEFAMELGVKKTDLRRLEHPKAKLSHYSKKTVDIEYKFPFGFKELYGLAHRGDFDLSQHSKASNQKLEYFDAENNKRFIPHVLEPTFGLDRSILAALLSAYTEEAIPTPGPSREGNYSSEIRIVMKFPKKLAPIKAAVFPLLKNKPELVKKAKSIYDELKLKFMCEFDDHGNIGKRYRRQDEIGTPYCVTVDFDSLEDKAATVRDRDTMKQERVEINKLENYLVNGLR